MYRDLNIGVVMPALDEERSIARVLRDIPPFVDRVVVADNGSSDRTAEIARLHGALVVPEPRRGYGAACLAGLSAIGDVDVVVFLDADYSDRPGEMARLLDPIANGKADLVVGSRVRGRARPGALTTPQRLGNALACFLLRRLFRVRYSDLGPFRAITRPGLRRLSMDDRTYGWTVQMQARAAGRGLRAHEVPVSYHPRIGRSKISGTVRGVIGAGTKIITTILCEAWRARRGGRGQADRLVVFARQPEPGRTKTRMIPLLGAEGAARLSGELFHATLGLARRVSRSWGCSVELRVTGHRALPEGRSLARGLRVRDQGEGDLGERMQRAVGQALSESCRRVVLVGTDCPLLTPETLEDAFLKLDDADLVLGPAQDGGYYLIGLRSEQPTLFADMPWSGPDLFLRTLEAARRGGLQTALLPELPDVDRPEDLRAWSRARRAGHARRPWLTVVVPTLNEEPQLAATLASVLSAEGVEIVVSDGGSTDRTTEIARAYGARVVIGPASRGRQLNAGAAEARCENLLFLHADTRLPLDYSQYVRIGLRSPGTSAVAFDLGIDAPGAGLRLVEAGVRLRSRLLQRPYGDQALAMRTATFRAAGGFPEIAFMEDYVMLDRLRGHGRIHMAAGRVRTSGRSWIDNGILRTTLLHQRLILLHRLRRAPHEHARPATRHAKRVPVKTAPSRGRTTHVPLRLLPGSAHPARLPDHRA